MEFFGLDIGSHNIKLVQLRRAQNNKYQIVAFGSASSTSKGLLSEAESDLTALAEIIKKLHQETGVKTKNVAAALPQDQIFTRVVTFPPLTEEELESALKWEAEQYVPVPLEEVTLTYEIIEKIKEDNKEKIEVLLAAAPKNLIDKTIKILKVAGFNPVSLEMEMTAIARSFVSSSSQTILIVDLGAKATDLAVVDAGRVIFVHSIFTAGEALTRAVSLELGLEPSQAEAYKKAYGADIEKLEGKISKAINPVLGVIIKEIEKTIQFCRERGKNLQRIVLVGGSASLPEVGSFLAKKLNLEVQIGNPFSQVVEDSLLTKIPPTDLSLYAVAVGLAMKEIG
jgi:type IV pilus assembly protein PilM